jgi:hypothetical protein
MKTIEEIRSEIQRIAEHIGAGDYPEKGDFKCIESVPACGDEVMPGGRGTRDVDVSRIRVDADGYHVFSRERGSEDESRVTQDFDELMYWSFEEAINCIASDDVYQNHFYDRGQDPLRLTHRRQVGMFAVISAACAHRRMAEIVRLLERSPYDDNRAERVDRYRELTFQGLSREAAWQAAEQQSPPIQPTQIFPPVLRLIPTSLPAGSPPPAPPNSAPPPNGKPPSPKH